MQIYRTTPCITMKMRPISWFDGKNSEEKKRMLNRANTCWLLGSTEIKNFLQQLFFVKFGKKITIQSRHKIEGMSHSAQSEPVNQIVNSFQSQLSQFATKQIKRSFYATATIQQIRPERRMKCSHSFIPIKYAERKNCSPFLFLGIFLRQKWPLLSRITRNHYLSLHCHEGDCIALRRSPTRAMWAVRSSGWQECSEMIWLENCTVWAVFFLCVQILIDVALSCRDAMSCKGDFSWLCNVVSLGITVITALTGSRSRFVLIMKESRMRARTKAARSRFDDVGVVIIY